MFELQFEPFVIDEKLKSWEIAVIPWDTETFGFGVSVLSPRYDDDYQSESGAIREALKSYSQLRRIDLITAAIPSCENKISLLLQKAGFGFVDMAYSIQYANLNEMALEPLPELALVPSVPDDVEVLVEMAGTSFQYGRYHQDVEIPISLADQRYRDWLRRCLDPNNRQQILTVTFQGSICGFSVVECNGNEGYLHLHAIDSKRRGIGLGIRMIVESVRYLYAGGARTVKTKISASNLKALNMHARLKGRFIAAEYLMHWHREEKK
jgi:hypothetical protein